MSQIPTHASYLAYVARAAHQTGKDLTLEEVAAVIEAVNTLGAADDTLASTGNTARDQEMYAAGRAVGEENAKHNAAIRGQAITQAPQLQALADKVVISNATGNESLFLAAVKELLAAVREFRPAAPASPVSTVEQAQDIRSRVMEVIAGVWDRATQIDDAANEVIDMLSPAPAAGDARDAVTEAIRILRAARGSIRNHQVSGPTGLSTDSRALVNADDDILQAVKVLKAAQRQGDAWC